MERKKIIKLLSEYRLYFGLFIEAPNEIKREEFYEKYIEIEEIIIDMIIGI